MGPQDQQDQVHQPDHNDLRKFISLSLFDSDPVSGYLAWMFCLGESDETTLLVMVSQKLFSPADSVAICV